MCDAQLKDKDILELKREGQLLAHLDSRLFTALI